MADTTYIKNVIETYVRQFLASSYPGHTFAERSIALPGGHFKCDAVSDDGSIIASIMSNRPRTVSGHEKYRRRKEGHNRNPGFEIDEGHSANRRVHRREISPASDEAD